MWRNGPPPPCKPIGGSSPRIPYTHGPIDPPRTGALWTGTPMKVRDSPSMSALWTGIHSLWVHYGPGPTLATINLHRRVSFTTYHPPQNHWGDTSHNQRVQPLSGKEADGTRALYRPEAPVLRRPKGATSLIYCEGRLPAHPTTADLNL